MRKFLLLFMLISINGIFAQDYRPMLSADTIFYVDPDGSDSNDCSQSEPCATPNRAIAQAMNYDFAGFNVTVKLADGNYQQTVAIHGLPYNSFGKFSLIGNTQSWDSVVLENGLDIRHTGMIVHVEGVKLKCPASGGLVVRRGYVEVQSIDFGDCYYHIFAHRSAFIQCTGNLRISGNAHYHIWLEELSWCEISNYTVTFSNPVNFSGEFLRVLWQCAYLAANVTFINPENVTGKKFFIGRNGIIDTNGYGSDYVPGSLPGTINTGGQII